ncbi:tetratricopeptide repeat protein [bacterium]|nr:tetratricopeptide repeat protein [bacterium]
MRRLLFTYLLPVWLLVQPQVLRGQLATESLDSTFHVLSLPELQSYRRYYVLELQSLQQEKQDLIQKGIDDGEKLLAVNPDAKMLDEMLIRLADLYYYQAKDDYISAMDEYEQAIIAAEQSGEPFSGNEPVLDLSKPLGLYERILDELPESDLVDDAVYNKAFLYEEMGDHERANDIYRYLTETYPNSPYVPEAYMRLGEYYFNPPVNDLETAIEYYKAIGPYKTNARYGESLYKLGWSYYRLSEYVQAISYFTALVEDVTLTRKYDPEGESAGVDLMEEALEYIAISFHDYGGPQKAVEYLNGIGRPDWSRAVMRNLGDVYMEQKEEYTNAITAYSYFLEFAPDAADAPITMRKIVDCYLLVDDDDSAFEERYKLFLTYKKGSVWWEQIDDENAKLTAYRLTEQALRENINTLIEQAGAHGSRAIYEQAVEMGRTYLDNFPEDEYAYMIRWNIALILDTRLALYKDALQEYLTICMVYNTRKYETFARNKGLSSIRDAAANAIVVSDSLVAIEQRSTGTPAPAGGADIDAPRPLSTAESWQAMAYDNYIKLFPFDEENTPLILANAGALYYIHNQFSEAIKYFNTLVQYFPESDQINTVKLSILDSYFGKKDYKSAEQLAKRILSAKPVKEIEERAKKRLGEAIFLNAQTFAEHQSSSLAAREFHRMALEAPTMEFADRALFNAALYYEKDADFKSAISAYENIISVYPASPLLYDAYNNLALDYAETGNYLKAATYYALLAERAEDGMRKRDALYNSFIFFEKAGEYRKAITAGQTYAETYPDSGDAEVIFYRTGECYLALGDTASGMRTFTSFAERFPESPLNVEVHFKLGVYYQARGEYDKAEQQFATAHETGIRWIEQGKELDGYYVSEALFLQTKLIHRRFNTIQLLLPRSRFDQSLREKQRLLGQLTDQYTRIAAYKTSRLPESVFCLGQIFEDYALTWRRQQLPLLSEEELVLKQKEVNERAIDIYERAISAFIDALDAIHTFGGSAAAAESGAGTGEWQARTEEKISEILYTIAEMNSESLQRFLDTPVPADLDDVAKLEYRNQVLFKIAKPLADNIVAAHERTVHVSDSLGIDNQWRRDSQAKINSYSLMLFREYGDLTLDAYESLRTLSRRYAYAALDRKMAPAESLPTSMINLTELAKTYGKAAVHFFLEGAQHVADAGENGGSVEAVNTRLVDFALTTVDTIDILLAIGEGYRKRADDLFQADDNLLFEDALTVFEDNIFFLQECRLELLETAYNAYRELPGSGAYGNTLLVRLMQSDPERFEAEYTDSIYRISVRTDSSWYYHEGLTEGGVSALTTVQGWKHPIQSPSALIWGRVRVDDAEQAVPDTIIIRKSIYVPGYPMSGTISFQTTIPEHIVVNNTLIEAENGMVCALSGEKLRQGDNLVVFLHRRDTGFSFYADVTIRYIPLPPQTGREK